MFIELASFILGLYFLIRGADAVVDSSSKIARRFGVSTFVVGLTIVAIGTSLPELIVNIFAAFEGSSNLGLGNIIGSNIANILLVLGFTAILEEVKINSPRIKTQIFYTILAPIAIGIIIFRPSLGLGPNEISNYVGLIFLVITANFIYSNFKRPREVGRIKPKRPKEYQNTKKVIFKLCLGILGLYFGGKFVVEGAIYIASFFGISQFLISASFIAIGTSLPELTVSLLSIYRKNVGLALGNVIGSNVVNVFGILGFVSILKPLKVTSIILPDLFFMLLASLYILYIVAYKKKERLTKRDGFTLLATYLIYLAFIISRG